MTKREALRAEYIAGWYEKDFAKLMRSTRADYRLDDPVEPALVPRDGLEADTRRWGMPATRQVRLGAGPSVAEDIDSISTIGF